MTGLSGAELGVFATHQRRQKGLQAPSATGWARIQSRFGRSGPPGTETQGVVHTGAKSLPRAFATPKSDRLLAPIHATTPRVAATTAEDGGRPPARTAGSSIVPGRRAPLEPWRGSPSGAFDASLVATRRPGPRARCARTLPHPTRRRGDGAEYEAAGRRRAASSAVFPTGREQAGQCRGTVSAVHAVGISRNTRGGHFDRTPRCGRPGTPRCRSTARSVGQRLPNVGASRTSSQSRPWRSVNVNCAVGGRIR